MTPSYPAPTSGLFHHALGLLSGLLQLARPTPKEQLPGPFPAADIYLLQIQPSGIVSVTVRSIGLAHGLEYLHSR